MTKTNAIIAIRRGFFQKEVVELDPCSGLHQNDTFPFKC